MGAGCGCVGRSATGVGFAVGCRVRLREGWSRSSPRPFGALRLPGISPRLVKDASAPAPERAGVGPGAPSVIRQRLEVVRT
ncbi:hypothetical protein GCM10017687_42560 [Streptomyces echinatus]